MASLNTTKDSAEMVVDNVEAMTEELRLMNAGPTENDVLPTDPHVEKCKRTVFILNQYDSYI